MIVIIAASEYLFDKKFAFTLLALGHIPTAISYLSRPCSGLSS